MCFHSFCSCSWKTSGLFAVLITSLKDFVMFPCYTVCMFAVARNCKHKVYICGCIGANEWMESNQGIDENIGVLQTDWFDQLMNFLRPLTMRTPVPRQVPSQKLSQSIGRKPLALHIVRTKLLPLWKWIYPNHPPPSDLDPFFGRGRRLRRQIGASWPPRWRDAGLAVLVGEAGALGDGDMWLVTIDSTQFPTYRAPDRYFWIRF